MLGVPANGVVLSGAFEEALARPTDVLVDFTSPGSVKQRTLDGLARVPLLMEFSRAVGVPSGSAALGGPWGKEVLRWRRSLEAGAVGRVEKAKVVACAQLRE